MEDLNKIYSKNIFFTICVFVIGLMLPYSRDNYLAFPLLTIVAVVLYGYHGKLLIDITIRLNRKETSIKELKFLFITLVVLCAGGYFFICVVDAKEQMISGLRVIKPFAEYSFLSFDGFTAYFYDLSITYINSIYYSIVVMTTLGDSSIVVENGMGRVIVAIEVTTALSITVFKIGEYYSERSSTVGKVAENRIINEVKKIDPSYTVDHNTRFKGRAIMKFTKRSRWRRKMRDHSRL